MPNNHLSIHISDRSHVNLTLNIYNCGNQDIEIDRFNGSDYYIFFFVKSGKGSFTQCQITHKIGPGQGFVVYPHEEAVIKAGHGGTLNVTWAAFSGYLVDQYLTRAKISRYEPVFPDTEDRALEAMFDSLLTVAQKPANRYCPLMAQLYTIFAFLLDHTPQKDKVDVAPSILHLYRALDFIDIYYHDDISVEDIARYVGMNRKALYRIFKEQTGFSTKDYLIYYRMNKAVNMLVNTTLTIEAIAMSVGYRDQFHFSKEFKKNVGYTPSEYRSVVTKDPSKGFRSPIDTVRQQFPSPVDDGSSTL